MSIPHSSVPSRGPLEVTGQRIDTEGSRPVSRPAPVAISAPQHEREASPARSRSRSPSLPRWSPSGNEARFGADSGAPFSAAPDPAEFLRRHTGEWAHSIEQPLTTEERWQQEAAQREAAKERRRSASASPPRVYGPGEIPHAHQSPPHPRRRAGGWPADRSASAEPQLHRDFLRAHTGGHAHPNLQPLPLERPDDEPEDFELELSTDPIVEAREPVQDRDASESPLRDLAPPQSQRYPFKRRQEGSPEPVQQRSASASPSPSPVRPSMQLHSHPLPVRPATAAPRPLPIPSTGAPLQPGSTIASYVQRFRQRPPQPPSAAAEEHSALPTFWWQTPAAASASAANVPPLPPPKQGTSTAEHLRQMEQQIEEQRAEKRQQKLQAALAKEMRAEQQQQQRQPQPHSDANQSFDQSRGDGGGSAVGDSSFADFSMLDNLDSQDALQQQQHAPPAAHDHPAQQPRQSILDDSDDFSALLAPPRSAQPPAPAAVDQSQLQSDVSALLSISPQRRVRSVGVVASPDVDELLRKWRAERAAGGPTYPQADVARAASMTALLQSSLPSSPAPVRARASRLVDSPASSTVDALISNLKKRLGLDQSRAGAEDLMPSRVPLRDIENQPQQHYHVAAHAIKRDRSTSPLASSRKQPSVLSSSPPRARLTARLHGSVEEMLDRPKVARQDYLDSTRRAAAEPSEQQVAEVNQPEPVPAAPEHAAVIPPLRLPVAADAPSVEATPAAQPPLASIQPSADAAVAAAPPVHDPSAASILAAAPAACSLPKADEAALLRLELQRLYAERAAECRGSHKKHRTHGRSRAARAGAARGPRGVITIQITPLMATTATEAAAPAPEASSVAAASSLPAEESESKQPIPRAAAAPSAPIESVHFVTNSAPTVVEYILPASPERMARAAARSSRPGSAAVSPLRAVVTDAAGSVREVVTRGLFCDASSYATIVSHLRPDAAAAGVHSQEPTSDEQQQKHTVPEEASHDAAAAVAEAAASLDSTHNAQQQQQQQASSIPTPAATSSLPAAAAVPSFAAPAPIFPQWLPAPAAAAAPSLQQPPVFVGGGGAMLLHTQQPSAQASPAAPLESSSAPSLFSPSHVHLARLCAELGMSVAEYYSDPPLQALVRQLDALQRQQQQVQHITQARMPLAH